MIEYGLKTKVSRAVSDDATNSRKVVLLNSWKACFFEDQQEIASETAQMTRAQALLEFWGVLVGGGGGGF